MKDISQVIREALKVKAEEFLSVIDELLSLLTDEMKKTKKLEINGRLVKVEPTGEAVVVGDLHGDIESLAYILKNCNFLESKDMLLVFLGDYGDRGAYSAEVYYTVIKLKLDHPEKVVLMRGNHEGPEDLLAYPHDLPIQFRARFGEKGTLAYTKIRQLFNYLYNAVYIKKSLLMVHGGLPAQAKSLEDIASAHKTHPQKTFLEEILWSDPHEGINGIVASPRGAGKLFGLDVTRRLLKILNAKLLIRGHEPSREGFKINHNRILTLFSRKGPPYYNMFGAYLQVQLSKEFENAEQLIPYVHRF